MENQPDHGNGITRRWYLQWMAGGGFAIVIALSLWKAIQAENTETRKYFREQLAKTENEAQKDRMFIQTELFKAMQTQTQAITLATTAMSQTSATQAQLASTVAELAEQQQDFLLKLESSIARLNSSVNEAATVVQEAGNSGGA